MLQVLLFMYHLSFAKSYCSLLVLQHCKTNMVTFYSSTDVSESESKNAVTLVTFIVGKDFQVISC